MDKVIPLHALVMVIHNDHKIGVSEAKRLFPSHEILTPDQITMDLVGQTNRSDLINICLTEMRHRVSLKLSLGERVVLVAPNLIRKEARALFARLGVAQGASVVYVIADALTDVNLTTGDGIADVIPLSQTIRVVVPMVANPLAFLRANFRGITVVGDVHGNLKAMQDAMNWAKSRNHFLWVLGDVIDCGPDTLQTLSAAYHMVMRGEGALMLGNHERKIARWLAQQDQPDGRSMKLSDGNRVTINAYKALSFDQRMQWLGKFRSVLSRASLMSQLGNLTFVHAAVHPDYWRHVTDNERAIEDFALYGEIGSAHGSEFSLAYRWIDQIPSGKLVFCGHDVRSTNAPLVITGAKGGRVVFLDTGCGKGGKLSSADLRFSDTDTIRLENFNQH